MAHGCRAGMAWVPVALRRGVVGGGVVPRPVPFPVVGRLAGWVR